MRYCRDWKIEILISLRAWTSLKSLLSVISLKNWLLFLFFFNSRSLWYPWYLWYHVIPIYPIYSLYRQYQRYLLIFLILFSLGLGRSKVLVLRFGPKINTKVAFNTTTTVNFLTSSRHSRRLKLGTQLNQTKPNPNLKKKIQKKSLQKNLSKNLGKKF